DGWEGGGGGMVGGARSRADLCRGCGRHSWRALNDAVQIVPAGHNSWAPARINGRQREASLPALFVALAHQALRFDELADASPNPHFRRICTNQAGIMLVDRRLAVSPVPTGGPRR